VSPLPITRALAAALAGVLLGATSVAAQRPVPRLTLAELERAALDSNPGLRAASLDVALARADVVTAALRPNPQASVVADVLPLGDASQLAVRSVGRIVRREDIERIVLASNGGTPVYVRDIAAVEIGALPPSGILGATDPDTHKDNDNAVQGLVLMRRGENPSDVLTGVKSRIAQLNAQTLLNGVKLRIVYDRTDLVETTLHNVGRTLFEGVSIVVIVLLLFLGSRRSAIAVAITIPLSLALRSS